jgi:hypothetical protein
MRWWFLNFVLSLLLRKSIAAKSLLASLKTITNFKSPQRASCGIQKPICDFETYSGTRQ